MVDKQHSEHTDGQFDLDLSQVGLANPESLDGPSRCAATSPVGVFYTVPVTLRFFNTVMYYYFILILLLIVYIRHNKIKTAYFSYFICSDFIVPEINNDLYFN